MSQMQQTIEYLKKSEVGCYVENPNNGRRVDIENMAGGRYLCLDGNQEVMKLTGNPYVAYMYLIGELGQEEYR